jgi:ribose-phosphate pyrophosphokinase
MDDIYINDNDNPNNIVVLNNQLTRSVISENDVIEVTKNIKFIVSNSNPELGDLIAKQLGIEKTGVYNKKHSNSEIKICIEDCVRRKNLYILSTGASNIYNSVNDNLMEAALIINACKLSSGKTISILMPCYPYARADKKDDGRTAIGASVVAKILKACGVTRIVSMDLHASQIQGFVDLPFDNLEANKLFVEFFKKNYFHNMSNNEINSKFVLISPDGGGVKRVARYAQQLKLEYVIMHKQRDYTKESTVLKSMLIGDINTVTNKIGIIIDDIVDTAGTMVSAAEELNKYGILGVIIVATHGILSGPAIDRINSCELIKQVVVTNTLPQLENKKLCPKLKIVDTSKLFSEVILRLETGRSISSLFA